jgi:hypothetical protein
MRLENFSRRTLRWILAIGGISLAAGVLLGIFQGDLMDFRSWGTDSFSKSAIGHRGFAHLLRELDIPVVVSTHASGAKAGASGLLIVAEPLLGDTTTSYRALFHRMLVQSSTRLVVLPKWRGIPGGRRPEWVQAVEPVSTGIVSSVLEALSVEAEVVRIPVTATGLRWAPNPYGPVPTLTAVQLLGGDGLEPLISCDRGVLLGAAPDSIYYGRTLILSDPDLIANHGLARGDNALLAVRIVDRLREGGGVVLDETLHGFSLRRSIWRSFFAYPLILVLIQVMVVTGMLVWTASVRFGGSVPFEKRISSGKEYFIANTSSLLQHGGHYRYVLTHYFNASIGRVARRLHLSGWTSVDKTIARLDAIGTRRGVTDSLSDLADLVGSLEHKVGLSATETLSAAQRIHRWRKGMTDGT